MKSILSTIWVIGIVACTGPSSEPQVETTEPIRSAYPMFEADSTTNMDSLYVECKREFERIRGQFTEAHEVYRRDILGLALSNPMLPEANRVFLRELETFVWNTTRDERHRKAAFERLLMPLFHRQEGRVSVFGFEHYIESNGYYVDGSFEGDLQRLDIRRFDLGMTDTMIFSPDVFAEHVAHRVKPIHLFTESRRIETRPIDFGYYSGDCIGYTVYPVDESAIRASDHPLIGSTLPLELRFERRIDVEERLRLAAMTPCYDCPGGGGPERVVASIRGAERLVFTTIEQTDEYNPLRSLIFLIDDTTFVRLWTEEFDQFGCSCI